MKAVNKKTISADVSTDCVQSSAEKEKSTGLNKRCLMDSSDEESDVEIEAICNHSRFCQVEIDDDDDEGEDSELDDGLEFEWSEECTSDEDDNDVGN